MAISADQVKALWNSRLAQLEGLFLWTNKMAISADQVKALWNSRLAQLEPEIIRPLTNYYFTRDIPIVEDLDKVSKKALWNSRLAQLEPEIIRPLTNYYFTRDIPIVEDLDKVSNVVALRNIKGIGQGTKDASGMSWLGKGANDLRGVDYELNATAVAVYTN